MSEAENREIQGIRAQIAFGLDCRAFMESPIGAYLTKRANDDIDTALDSLRSVNPTDPEAIRALQNDIRCAENFLTWMGEAVTEGENAERAFIESTD